MTIEEFEAQFELDSPQSVLEALCNKARDEYFVNNSGFTPHRGPISQKFKQWVVVNKMNEVKKESK